MGFLFGAEDDFSHVLPAFVRTDQHPVVEAPAQGPAVLPESAERIVLLRGLLTGGLEFFTAVPAALQVFRASLWGSQRCLSCPRPKRYSTISGVSYQASSRAPTVLK